MDFERAGGAHIGSARRQVDLALRWFREHSSRASLGARHWMADLTAKVEVARLLGYRIAFLREQGVFPNYEASMLKLMTSQVRQETAALMMSVVGLHAHAQPLPTSAGIDWGHEYLDAVSATVAQGSSEIQRNVISTRGLGLPRG